MPDLSKAFLLRMTHIDNIPDILKKGIIHLTSPNANPNFVSIGDKSLISTRNDFILDNGKRLGEYIPFYFGTRMPMLYVVQNGFNTVAVTPAKNIVYCVSSVQKMIDLAVDFLFTDGHATDGFTTQFTGANIQDIDSLLDWKAINDKYWVDENDLDKKRKKQAEFLVLGDIPPEAILGYIVYNQAAHTKVINFGAAADKVHIKPEHYF